MAGSSRESAGERSPPSLGLKPGSKKMIASTKKGDYFGEDPLASSLSSSPYTGKLRVGKPPRGSLDGKPEENKALSDPADEVASISKIYHAHHAGNKEAVNPAPARTRTSAVGNATGLDSLHGKLPTQAAPSGHGHRGNGEGSSRRGTRSSMRTNIDHQEELRAVEGGKDVHTDDITRELRVRIKAGPGEAARDAVGGNPHSHMAVKASPMLARSQAVPGTDAISSESQGGEFPRDAPQVGNLDLPGSRFLDGAPTVHDAHDAADAEFLADRSIHNSHDTLNKLHRESPPLEPVLHRQQPMFLGAGSSSSISHSSSLRMAMNQSFGLDRGMDSPPFLGRRRGSMPGSPHSPAAAVAGGLLGPYDTDASKSHAASGSSGATFPKLASSLSNANASMAVEREHFAGEREGETQPVAAPDGAATPRKAFQARSMDSGVSERGGTEADDGASLDSRTRVSVNELSLGEFLKAPANTRISGSRQKDGPGGCDARAPSWVSGSFKGDKMSPHGGEMPFPVSLAPWVTRGDPEGGDLSPDASKHDPFAGDSSQDYNHRGGIGGGRPGFVGGAESASNQGGDGEGILTGASRILGLTMRALSNLPLMGARRRRVSTSRLTLLGGADKGRSAKKRRTGWRALIPSLDAGDERSTVSLGGSVAMEQPVSGGGQRRGSVSKGARGGRNSKDVLAEDWRFYSGMPRSGANVTPWEHAPGSPVRNSIDPGTPGGAFPYSPTALNDFCRNAAPKARSRMALLVWHRTVRRVKSLNLVWGIVLRNRMERMHRFTLTFYNSPDLEQSYRRSRVPGMMANLRKLVLLALVLLLIVTITFAALPPADINSCRPWWPLVGVLYFFLLVAFWVSRCLTRAVVAEEFGRREYRQLVALPAVLCLGIGTGVILLRNVGADVYLPLQSDLALALLALTFCHHLVSQTAARFLLVAAGFLALNLTVLIEMATRDAPSFDGVPAADRPHAMQHAVFLPYSAFLNIILALYSLILLGAGYSREWDDRRSFILMNQVSASKVRSEALLENMLPRSILRALEGGRTLISEEFEEVSIMFIYIDGFNAYTASTPPKKLITFLNDVFSAIDKLVESREVYKIETVGDVYMVGGGVPDPCDDHAERVGLLALDLMKLEAGWETSEKTGNLPLRLRIGVHCGPIVAGVIGLKRLHYRVFGDTVNVASRMGSHGSVGKVHCTDNFHAQLVDEGFVFESRGEIMVKGKGMTHTFYLLGGPPGWDHSIVGGRHNRRTAMDGRFWQSGQESGSGSLEHSRDSRWESSGVADSDGDAHGEARFPPSNAHAHPANTDGRNRERSITWAGDCDEGGPGAKFTSGLLSRCKSGVENGFALLQAPAEVIYRDGGQPREEGEGIGPSLTAIRSSFEQDSASIGSHLRHVGFDMSSMSKLEAASKSSQLGSLPMAKHLNRRKTMPVEILPAMHLAMGERELRRASQHQVNHDQGDGESSSPTGSFSDGHGSIKRRHPLGKTRLKVLRAVAVAPAPLMALRNDEVEAMCAAAVSPRHSHLEDAEAYDSSLRRATTMALRRRMSADSLLHVVAVPSEGAASSFQSSGPGSPPPNPPSITTVTNRSGSLSPMKRLVGFRIGINAQKRSPSLDLSMAVRRALGSPAPPSHYSNAGVAQGGASASSNGADATAADAARASMDLIRPTQGAEFFNVNRGGRRGSIQVDTNRSMDTAGTFELRRSSMGSINLQEGAPGFGLVDAAVPAGLAVAPLVRPLRSGSWNGTTAHHAESLAGLSSSPPDEDGGRGAGAHNPLVKSIDRVKVLEMRSSLHKFRPMGAAVLGGTNASARDVSAPKRASLGISDATAVAAAGHTATHHSVPASGGSERSTGKPPRSRMNVGLGNLSVAPDSPNTVIDFLSPDRWWQSPAKGSPQVMPGLRWLTTSFTMSPFGGDKDHGERPPSVIVPRRPTSSFNSSLGDREREEGYSHHGDRLPGDPRGGGQHADNRSDASVLFSDAAMSAFLAKQGSSKGGGDGSSRHHHHSSAEDKADDDDLLDQAEMGLDRFDPQNGGLVSLMKPITLRFWLHPNWEKRYRRETISMATTKVRLVYSAVLFLLLIYTGFDIYEHRDFTYTFWCYVMRVSYGLAVALALFLIRANSAVVYELITVSAAIGGIVVVAVSYECTGFDPISESMVSTVILSLPATMLVMGLRFTTASATGLLILLLYYGYLVVTMAILDRHDDFETAPVVTLCLYLLLQWALLMGSCHSTELERRRKFLVDEEIRQQKVFTNRILCNLMPPLVANQLRRGERHIVDSYSEASVLYADIVGFTPLSATLGPLKLVVFLNRLFSDFDMMCDKHSITKINTIGDCYTCMAGVPMPDPDHCMAVVEMGLSMLLALDALQEELTAVFEGLPHVDMRVGVHTGSLIAGVVGIKNLRYDVWGETITITNKMESSGLPGRIHLSRPAYEQVKEAYRLEPAADGTDTFFLVV